jgi:phosphoglycerate kinase
MRKIQKVDASGKKILLRVDYNVPIKNGQVQSNERILASLETINYLLEQKATVVICSHLGRPGGKPNTLFSLKPAAKELQKLIKKSVQFSDNCIEAERDNKIRHMGPGEILFLENLRFNSGEESNDSAFAKKLAESCELYVNDAFSASHREHASVVEVTKFLPSYAGFCMQKEVENLSKILVEPQKPFVLVMGGAKMADKIPLILNMMGKIDTLILGGAIANTFLLAKGYRLGRSIVEPESIDVIRKIFIEARDRGVEIRLPEDGVVAEDIGATSGREKPINVVAESEMILDIGNNTAGQYAQDFKLAETVFWNGPMGYAETPAFADGTKAIGQAIANSNAFSVIGGGDTISALSEEVSKKFGYVSTAGGAALEFLSGRNLPGLSALEDK